MDMYRTPAVEPVETKGVHHQYAGNRKVAMRGVGAVFV